MNFNLRFGGRVLVCLSLIAALVFGAFGPTVAIQAQYDGTVPEELVVGMIPSREPAELLPDLEPFANLLLKRLQERGFDIQSVRAFVPESEAATVAALGTGEVHVGFMGPFSAVQAEQQEGAKILTSSVRFGNLFYRGQLMANQSMGNPNKGPFIGNFDDLVQAVKDGKDLTMSYSSTGSTSGFLFPCLKLKNAGILPGNHDNFNTVVAGGHTSSALSVLRGDADIGWGYDDVRLDLVGRTEDTGLPSDMSKMEQVNTLTSRIKLLGYTDYIPNDPQVAADNLSSELTAAIQEELVALSNSEQGSPLLESLLDATELQAVQPSNFDAVRQVVSEIQPIRDRCL
ncbi:MAG: phosphate/phosphite/phosphonate ABC transporter substrate-binding protein [Candidatus Bipolaricaulia bacterium]